MHKLIIRAVDEPAPGPQTKAILTAYLPAYLRWMDRAPEVSPATCEDRLNEYMPELLPVYERLLGLTDDLDGVGSRDDRRRFFSLYRPPPLVRGCSQAIVQHRQHDGDTCPVLIRAYDHAPQLFDGLLLRSSWSGTSVISMTDCAWGALDGINQHGLAVALAFSGRYAIGDGFAAPLIVRYLLETCATTDEARRTLSRVPAFMPYTFVVVDPTGDRVTAFLAPDRPAELTREAVSTNHNAPDDWPDYAKFTQSIERRELLESIVDRDADQPATLDDALPLFLRPPIWRTGYARASGTLYVAAYDTGSGSLDLYWPEEDQPRQERFSLADFQPRTIVQHLRVPG